MFNCDVFDNVKGFDLFNGVVKWFMWNIFVYFFINNVRLVMLILKFLFILCEDRYLMMLNWNIKVLKEIFDS